MSHQNLKYMKPITTQQITKAERIAVLMVRYMLGTITPDDHDELDEFVKESDLNMRLFEEMTLDNIADLLKKLVNS